MNNQIRDRKQSPKIGIKLMPDQVQVVQEPPALPTEPPRLFVPPEEQDYPPIPPRLDIEAMRTSLGWTSTKVSQGGNRTSFISDFNSFRSSAQRSGPGLLIQGLVLSRLGKNGSLHREVLYLSEEKDRLIVGDLAGRQSKDLILIKDIASIEKGHHSDLLKQFASVVGDDILAFSITSNNPEIESLDFVAADELIRNLWCAELFAVVDALSDIL